LVGKTVIKKQAKPKNLWRLSPIVYIFALISISCSSNKIIDNEKLFNTSWELEYISGPDINFNDLYPNKKPTITFDKITKKVTGNNSCNGYAADYT
jgi:heat shock protein HslJ